MKILGIYKTHRYLLINYEENQKSIKDILYLIEQLNQYDLILIPYENEECKDILSLVDALELNPEHFYRHLFGKNYENI